MVYDYSNVIRKINELLEKNEQFCQRVDQMTEEIGELNTIVRNLNKNNVTNETIEVEQAIQLPALNEPIRQDINLVKSTPNSTHLYGKEEHHLSCSSSFIQCISLPSQFVL